MTDPSKLLFEYLRYSSGPGAPADTRAMNINGSVTPAVYQYTVTDTHADICHVNMSIVDNSIEPEDFGGILNGLTNGIKIEAIDTDGGTVLKDFMDGETVKQNYDFTMLAGVDALPAMYTGDDFLVVHWTIAKAGHVMRLKNSQSFRMTIQDDLTGLTHFTAMLQGVVEL